MNLPILTIQEIKNHEPRCFIIYSDNILESTNVLDLMSVGNKFLEIVGVSYEPIDQPIYLFKEKIKGSFICIKVAGKYENWNLPNNVDSIIRFIDKPDFMIIDGVDGEGVFVGETTGTANVGNSQWQREGRKISAAEKSIPMIYQTYYSGTDRSMFDKEEIDNDTAQGQVREPSSLQVINHFIYSLRYRVPSLVVYYPNPAYDKIIGFSRENIGQKYLKDYISVCLLYKKDKNYKSIKKKVEVEIYKKMLAFLTEIVNNRRGQSLRIDKDFPIEPTHNILTTNGELFIHYLVNFINGDTPFKEKFNIINWDYKTFVPWQHRYNKTSLLGSLATARLPLVSYLKGATKAGIALNTRMLISFLNLFYPKERGKFIQKLNPRIPTLIIPTLMFQKTDNKYIYKVDPGTGEIVAFAELFARDIRNNRTMNTLIYVHVPGPKKFSTMTKLFRAIKRYADCLIINEKIYDF